MSRRLLVNDCLTCIEGTRTFWHDLQEWFGMEFVGGDYSNLAQLDVPKDATLIVRNATWFPPIKTDVPTISLLQDIMGDGVQRQMQISVLCSSRVVYNSAYTASKYNNYDGAIIPLPVDFDLFCPASPALMQQKLSLPPGCVLWVGASQGAAAQVKGWTSS